MLRLAGVTFEDRRLPDGLNKQRLVQAIQSAAKNVKLKRILRFIGLTPSRYHHWTAKKDCQLTDISTCPRSSPQQITLTEVDRVKQFVTCEAYRHIPTGNLVRLAQRMGIVFASAGTWYRLIRKHGWRRPRKRIHPVKPKVGIRATRPNELWHVDITVIRLLNGSKVYLHGLIDNFSRRVLAWKTSSTFDPSITAELLTIAAKNISEPSPTDSTQVMVDGGVENLNGTVDAALVEHNLKRILAKVDVTFSNSMIESFWRSLKHKWLFLNTLDSLQAVTTHVGFYIQQHNEVIPHAAFKGQTPNEMYFQTGGEVANQLMLAHAAAREARLAANRARSCGACGSVSQVHQIKTPEPPT